MATVQHRIGVIFALFFLLLALAAGRTCISGRCARGRCARPRQTQQLSNETVPAQRGTIADRNGVDLAVSEPAQDISADPYLVKDPLQAAQKLAPLLGQPQARCCAKLSERRGFVYLARALPARQARAVMALKLEGIADAGDAPRLPARRRWPRRCSASSAPKAKGCRGSSTRTRAAEGHGRASGA